MLPFLKHRDDGGMAGPVESIERKPDEGAEFDMLDAIAEDLLMAFEKKDKMLLKSAIESLVEHIQSQDQAQDMEMPDATA